MTRKGIMEKTSTRLLQLLLPLLLLFVDSLAAGVEDFRCRDLRVGNAPATCSCSNGEPIELQCPINDSLVNLSIKNSNNHMNIQCLQPQRPGYLDLDLFPSTISVPEIGYIKIEFCALNVSFDDLLRKFRVTSLKELIFESILDDEDPNGSSWSSSGIRVTKEMFDSLRDLEALTLSHVRAEFEEDFLANVPKLTELTMNDDFEGPLGHYFPNLTRLKSLDLARNRITVLPPDGGFRTLTELKQLHLFNNRIAQISDETFAGLTNLTLLELSINRISELSENAFASLPNLERISLRNNRIGSLHENTFSRNPSLQRVSLSINPNIVLPDRLFANLTSLVSVDLSNDLLETIPEHVFGGCSALKTIDLHNNSLTSLPDKLFGDLHQLETLDLSKNKLSALTSNALASLRKLQQLKLDQNRFTSIDEFYFRKLPNLKILNLARNNIAFIHPKALEVFGGTLTELDLSHNAWNDSYGSPLNSFQQLEKLSLHHNRLVSVPELYTTTLNHMDLSHNRIDYLPIASYTRYMSHDVHINLSGNEIREVDFTEAEYLSKENRQGEVKPAGHWIIYLQNNPIVCDCSNYDLFRYFNHEMPDVEFFVRINQTDSCANDGNRKISDVRPINVHCSVIDSCPEPCNCSYSPYDDAINVNCSDRQLSSYPDIQSLPIANYSQVYVNLRGNRLTATQFVEGYSSVTKLDLSENRLSRVSWIPPSIKELNLSSNALKTLERVVLVQLENNTALVRLELQDNPWDCTCVSFELQKFLTQHYHKVNTSTVICANSRKPLVALTLFCPSATIIAGASFAILFLVLFPIVTMALYYRYRTEIKVYLYAKNLCMWFITEEELDKDKTYDVFISYASEDQDFVDKHLLKELEHGDHPYKVCIHVRDWTPGELIVKQVIDSVKDSRRTLVVLSNHFMDSVWGKLEFRTAHTEAISEGRARVIAVVYGDLDESRLDAEIRAYMKTNTYVQWGDKYFWQKLKYALPHSRHFYDNNKKRVQVMRKIDDKFDLITSPPSPGVMSTPPITALDPTLLDSVKVEGQSPLLFRKASDM